MGLPQTSCVDTPHGNSNQQHPTCVSSPFSANAHANARVGHSQRRSVVGKRPHSRKTSEAAAVLRQGAVPTQHGRARSDLYTSNGTYRAVLVVGMSAAPCDWKPAPKTWGCEEGSFGNHRMALPQNPNSRPKTQRVPCLEEFHDVRWRAERALEELVFKFTGISSHRYCLLTPPRCDVLVGAAACSSALAVTGPLVP